nr:MAG TPA: hypothetical protein [Caudoviricetes sp.]
MIWSNYNRTDISSEKYANNYLLRELISFIIRRNMMGGG